MIQNFKLIPIVRENSDDEAKKQIEKIIDLGFKVIEITFTTPNANEIIKKLKNNNPNIYVGAGTISSLEEAKMAIESKADFLVSPFFVDEVNRFTKINNILYIPGVMTINEIFHAKNNGCDFIKLFPANRFGKDYIKQIHSVMPNVKIMATGGVEISEIDKWLNVNVSCVGIGKNLFSSTKEDLKKYV